MSGMDEKRDERVGMGESGVRIRQKEASYMRDWWLTWRPVCDRKSVTEQGNAKTKLPGKQDTMAINLRLLSSLVEQIHP